MLKKATKLSEIPAAFPPAPLADDEFKDFYVTVDCERDSCLSRVDELKKKLEKDYIKILFAGHRGSGKSTELNRLKREIEPGAFVVQFSVIEELDINDINYIDLIMVMMEKLADKSAEKSIIKENSKNIEQIKNWLAQVTQIKAEETGYQMEVKAGLKTDRGIVSLLIGLYAEYKAAVKTGSNNKTEYRQELDKKISVLKAYCNILINEIEIALKEKNKYLLLVIEDLDKADTSKIHEIFFKHSGILSELNTKIIFTVSIFALTTPNLADLGGKFELVCLPMLKVMKKEGGRFDKGHDAIKKIVNNRAEECLFDDTIIDLMIERSGGVLRDLFEMIDTASNSADFNKRDKVSKQDSDYAFSRLKNKFLGMLTIIDEKESKITTDDLYKKLVEVSKSIEKKLPLNSTMFILLSCLAVVEYNGEQWFDVHPAVKSLLKDMGKI